MGPIPWLANVASVAALPAFAFFALWYISRGATQELSEAHTTGERKAIATVETETTDEAEATAASIPSSLSSVIQFADAQDSIAIYNLHYDTAGDIDAITLEAWVKTSSTRPQIIASWDRDEYWRLGIGTNRLETRQRVLWATTDEQGTTTDTLGTVQITDGQWHFVAVTYDTTTRVKRIYVDGRLDTESRAHDGLRLGTGTPRYGFLGVGSKADHFNGEKRPQFCLQGSLAEVRIWNRARTPQEIQMQMHYRLTGQEAGLVGYWPLDRIEERNGIPIVLDLTPHQNHGCVNGATALQDTELPIVGQSAASGC